MGDDITDFRVVKGGQNASELKKAVELLREGKEHLNEYLRIMAELHKAKYDALISEGFTPQEALVLCKDVFYS